jgi:hypothetical protein
MFLNLSIHHLGNQQSQNECLEGYHKLNPALYKAAPESERNKPKYPISFKSDINKNAFGLVNLLSNLNGC